jgi:hypothetical protein
MNTQNQQPVHQPGARRWLLLLFSAIVLLAVGAGLSLRFGIFSQPAASATPTHVPERQTPLRSTDVARASAQASEDSSQSEITAAATQQADGRVSETTVASVATASANSEAHVEATSAAPAALSETAPASLGALAWRDRVLANDTVIISISGLSRPDPGTVYAAWLSSDQNSLPLGALTFSSDGTASLTYTAPNHDNLLGLYDKVYITNVLEAQATTEMTGVLLSGALPQQALIGIRRVLFSNETTPNNLGFALGLRQQSDEVLRQAQFLQEGFEIGDLAEERLIAEYLVNIIEGDQGEHFGDLNGDGRIENPGDGYGLLSNGDKPGYINGLIEHVQLAAEAQDATEAIKTHAVHVQITGENARVRFIDVRDRALRIAQAGEVDATQQDVVYIMALLQQAIYGIDLNLNEKVDPVPGEGGVVTAYQHAQLMVSVSLSQNQK